MADWRLAKSLEKLRAQVNLARPNRSKSSDGSIGDQSHANRNSDHNPHILDGTMGVVSAIDITHDPKGGFDSYAFAEWLRTKKDKRIKYIISNRKIANSVTSPWVWRPYSGSNPHDHHVHVSVMATKSLYDDTSDWDLEGMFDGTAPGPSGTPDKPTLRRGDQGAAVKELQTLLKIEADGYFGPNTEAAVTAFQEKRDLVTDGIVGGYTWAELEKQASEPILNNPVQSNIVATKFGGGGDPNNSAYPPYAPITDSDLGVALPFRFKDPRPQVKVTNRANNKSVVCSILDIGPWNIDDPYWSSGQRPQAESGRDEKGRVTNLAGIDLTPAADKAIELGGLGKVNWEFVGGSTGEHPAPDYDALNKAVEEIAKLSAELAKATAALNEVIAAVAKPEGTA